MKEEPKEEVKDNPKVVDIMMRRFIKAMKLLPPKDEKGLAKY